MSRIKLQVIQRQVEPAVYLSMNYLVHQCLRNTKKSFFFVACLYTDPMQTEPSHIFLHLRSFLAAGLEGLDALLFPPYCILCQTPVRRDDEGLCPTCWRELSRCVAADYCRRCGRNASPFSIVNGRCGACQDEALAFDGLFRAGVYESALRSLVLAFKFHQRTEYAPRLGRMMKDALSVSGFRGDSALGWNTTPANAAIASRCSSVMRSFRRLRSSVRQSW